jgi:hypothetical protein
MTYTELLKEAHKLSAEEKQKLISALEADMRAYWGMPS